MTDCKCCGNLIVRRFHEGTERFTSRKYCGRTCSDAHRGTRSDAEELERFMVNVMPEPMSGCWLWLGHYNPHRRGYGTARIRKTEMKAHRASFLLFKGEIPNGLVVRHRCDNPHCVNPDHLLVGTHQDNNDDKIARGRHLVGERSPNAKLTEEAVRDIRTSAKSGVQLAAEYGVCTATISVTRSRKHWSHVQ